MIRHVVLFRFAETFFGESERLWTEGVAGLLGQVPGLRSVSLGRDVMGAERSWDYALVSDFDSLADVRAYASHPAHLPLIALSGAHATQIVSVDYETPEPGTEQR